MIKTTLQDHEIGNGVVNSPNGRNGHHFVAAPEKAAEKAPEKARMARHAPVSTSNGQMLGATTATTNNGWDIVTSLDATALTYLIRQLIPSSFPLTVGGNDYTVQTTAASSTCTPGASNMITAVVPVSGTPTSNSPDAPVFNGTTTVKLDVSQVVMNAVRNAYYLSLDGSSYLSADSKDTFSSATGFTMEAWVNLTKPASANPQVICGYSSSNNPSPAFLISANAGSLGLKWGSTEINSNSIPNLANGNWHHVAVSVAATDATFYVDGLPQGTASLGSQSGVANTFCIGYLEGDTSPAYFNGDITDVRVWKTSRTPEQIQTYMNINMVNVPTADQSGLVELWRFTGDINAPVNLVGSGATGSRHGEAHVEQVPSSTKARYIFNFLTTSATELKLDVQSSLDDTSLEDDFNTALEDAITTDVLPYAQPLRATFAFQTYSGVVMPTNVQFITLANANYTSNQPYQVMALAMCSHRLFPAGDPATLFASDKTVMVPDDGKSNMVASVSDYQYLSVRQSAINSKANADLQLVENDGQWKLQSSGSKRVGKWYYFTNLKSFEVFIETAKGIKRTMSLTSLLFNINNVDTTLVLTPEPRTSSGAQKINRSFTDVNVDVGINWVFFSIMAVILLGLGFLFGTIIGLIVIALILYFVIYKRLDSWADKVQTLITDKLEGADINNVNTNANFTINSIQYNEALIAQGLLGAAAFDMKLNNPKTDTAVVNYLEEDTLNLTFINDFGEVQFYNSGASPSVITIAMPAFLQSAVPGMQLQSTSSWQAGTSGSGNDEVLTLTNLDGLPWKKGEKLEFTIDKVYCDYLNKDKQPVASGAVTAKIQGTDYKNGTIETAARVTEQGVNPDSHLVSFSLVQPDAFTILSQKQSPQPQNTTQRAFIQLYEVEITVQDQPVKWQLGYKNVAKGMEAYMQQSDQTSVNYAGTPIQYDASQPNLSTTANMGGIGGKPGITVQFVVPNTEA